MITIVTKPGQPGYVSLIATPDGIFADHQHDGTRHRKIDTRQYKDVAKLLVCLTNFEEADVTDFLSLIYSEGFKDGQKPMRKAVHVINMFDQANTGQAIKKMGSRAILLKKAIEKLRAAINANGQKTILDARQVS